MTEQEAIKELHSIRPRGGIIPQKRAEAIDVAIKALEEVKQYRVIGTPEKIKEELDRLRNDNECQGLYFTLEERQDLARQYRELEEYKSIGTPEECRAAMEQLKAAKEDIRKLLCEEYGSSCKFCIQSDNEDAMCSKACGSGSWCCENAAWKSHRLE